jgi:beta-N-acetylhexosaminidase
LEPATQRTLEDLHVGAVILFRRNAGTPAEIAALTAQLHALPSQPLVAIDHEGGRVMRLGAPFTQFPPAAAIGRTGDSDIAYRVGRAMALELASVGIDMSFAPVLDVHSNPANPVIGDRAFGSDPALVSAMGIAMMRGLLDGGVIPCGKHFPGHGDTARDSHLELPVVRRSREQLERTELVPFRAAIAAAIPMLMTAHVQYPALDPNHPATLSRAILTDLLRDALGFTGVIASDDLYMRAIVDHHSIGEAAIATLAAGADALLVCQDLQHATEAFTAIERAVGDGTLSATTIAAAAGRIAHLRELPARRGATTCELPNPQHQSLVEEITLKR